MKSNFSFFEEKWPLMASLGSMAEKYLYTDSNSCLIKLGLFAEAIVQLMFMLDKLPEPQVDNTHANRIKVLVSEGLLPNDIQNILYAIRISRNDAVHNSYESTKNAKILLEYGYMLGSWFMQTYGNWNFEPLEFVMPQDISRDINFKAVIGVLEERINQLAEKINTSQRNETDVSVADRRKRAKHSVGEINLSLKEARYGLPSPKLENGETEIKIGAFIRSTTHKLVQDDAITEEIVAMLCSKSYCKQTFDLNYPFLKRVENVISLSEQRKVNGYDRYWANEQTIHAGKYFVCNDWYERNRVPFIKWVGHIYKSVT